MLDTKADFKAIRETVGLSQQDVADELGINVRSVKRWEHPTESNAAPQDAWDLLSRYLELQDAALAAVAQQLDEVVSAAGREPDLVPITYYRDQRHYNVYGRDPGIYSVANANARAVALMLSLRGIATEFRYPEEGAVRTEGSRY